MSQVGQTDTSQNKKHSNQMCEQKMVVSMQANGLMWGPLPYKNKLCSLKKKHICVTVLQREFHSSISHLHILVHKWVQQTTTVEYKKHQAFNMSPLYYTVSLYQLDITNIQTH